MKVQVNVNDRLGWWVCACVKGGSVKHRRPSTHIKMHPPTTKKCSACGVTKEQHDAIQVQP
jgi:hypothetical protein